MEVNLLSLEELSGTWLHTDGLLLVSWTQQPGPLNPGCTLLASVSPPQGTLF